MPWNELVQKTADRSGVSPSTVRAVCKSLVEVLTEEIQAGRTARLPGLGSFWSAWQPERTMRSVSDGHRLVLDGRHVARFRAATALKDALRELTPQPLADPEHQRAWRLAEALVGDLVLYNPNTRPALSGVTEPNAVHSACASTFGNGWEQARARFEREIPATVRVERDHLSMAAVRRFADANP